MALQLARWKPYRLQSLALYEPVAVHLLSPDHRGRVELEAVRDDLQRCADRGDALLGAQRFIDYWSGAGSFVELPRTVSDGLAGLVPKTLLDFAALSREKSSVDDYRCISAPVSLFRHQRPTPAARRARRAGRALPQARRHRVDAGHMAPVTHAVWSIRCSSVSSAAPTAATRCRPCAARQRNAGLTTRARAGVILTPTPRSALGACVFRATRTMPIPTSRRRRCGPRCAFASMQRLAGRGRGRVRRLRRAGRGAVVGPGAVAVPPGAAAGGPSLRIRRRRARANHRGARCAPERAASAAAGAARRGFFPARQRRQPAGLVR